MAFSDGSILEIDVVTSLPTAPTYVVNSSTTAGFVGADKAVAKTKKHKASVEVVLGATFMPFSLELFGSIEKSSHDLLKTIASSKVDGHPDLYDYDQVLTTIMETISVGLQNSLGHAFRSFNRYVAAQLNNPVLHIARGTHRRIMPPQGDWSDAEITYRSYPTLARLRLPVLSSSSASTNEDSASQVPAYLRNYVTDSSKYDEEARDDEALQNELACTAGSEL
jgi:hypothetical protein